MDEIWKDISGYEGLYQVSDMGHVRSLPRPKCFTKPHFKVTHSGRQLKPFLAGQNQYPCVALWKDSKPKKYYIHRLVLSAFIGEAGPDMTGNHKNGICADNRLTNLEWITQAGNNLHSYRALNRTIVSCDGERDGNAKLTWIQVDRIRTLNSEDPKRWTANALATEFHVSPPTIYKILRRATWKTR